MVVVAQEQEQAASHPEKGHLKLYYGVFSLFYLLLTGFNTFSM
jgi:hypothetical protein